MLSQFQTRYSTGSLISDLLTISQGKFVVRVSAQIEGVTRATGMAAAETIELAEDRARSRALAVLGIEPAVSVIHPSKSEVDYSERFPTEDASTPEQQIQINTFSSEPSFDIRHDLNNLAHLSSQVLPQDSDRERELLQEEEFSPQIPKSMQHLAFISSTTPVIVEELELIPEKQGESSRESPNSLDNVTPLPPLNYSPQDTSWLEPNVVEAGKKTSDPVDLSDAIARTDIEIKRLKWDNQQGREYLKQKYGKQSRQKLTDEELLEFLHYLKSQPSP